MFEAASSVQNYRNLLQRSKLYLVTRVHRFWLPWKRMSKLTMLPESFPAFPPKRDAVAQQKQPGPSPTKGTVARSVAADHLRSRQAPGGARASTAGVAASEAGLRGLDFSMREGLTRRQHPPTPCIRSNHCSSGVRYQAAIWSRETPGSRAVINSHHLNNSARIVASAWLHVGLKS